LSANNSTQIGCLNLHNWFVSLKELSFVRRSSPYLANSSDWSEKTGTTPLWHINNTESFLEQKTLLY
jgi:hypothetical protein